MISSRNAINGEAHPSRRITGHLYRSLEPSLTKLCAAEYDTGILLRCSSFEAETSAIKLEAGGASELRMKVACRGLRQFRITLRVAAAGIPNFELRCTVEEGDTWQLIYRTRNRSLSGDFGIPRLGECLVFFSKRLMPVLDCRAENGSCAASSTGGHRAPAGTRQAASKTLSQRPERFPH